MAAAIEIDSGVYLQGEAEIGKLCDDAHEEYQIENFCDDCDAAGEEAFHYHQRHGGGRNDPS